jgi:hypothetical protein
VSTTNVHLANINRLARVGIVLGGPGGAPPDRYGPDQAVTRDQMASFVARAVAYSTGEPLTSDWDHFTDDLGDVHAPSIDAVAEHGIAVGVDGERFEPHRGVTRDQMAGFLVRSLAVLEDRALVRPLPR